MISRRTVLRNLAVTSLIVVTLPAFGKSRQLNPIKMFDTDNDGTVDLAAADPDHDGTLTKDEYLAVVEQRFNAANQDSDGTLDAKEFGTKSGQSLMRLLR